MQMILETRPRRHWHPIMAEEYQLLPWAVEDLTPLELAAIVHDLQRKEQQAVAAQAGLNPGGRR